MLFLTSSVIPFTVVIFYDVPCFKANKTFLDTCVLNTDVNENIIELPFGCVIAQETFDWNL